MNNKRLIDEIKKSKAGMDTLFASRLEKQLHAKAEEILQPQKGLSLFNNKVFMRRFSFSGIAFLLLVASGVNIAGPFISEYKANSFLSNVSKVYAAEAEKDGIYYEKSLNIHSQVGKESESEILETWYDNKGNRLSIVSDQNSGKNIATDLEKVNEFGNTGYHTNANIEQSEENEERVEALNDKYICVEKTESENSGFYTTMEISKSDPSVYVVYGFSEEKNETNPLTEVMNELKELQEEKSAVRAKKILEQIQSNDNVIFEQTDSEFIFTVDMWQNSNFIYTFEKETYKLQKTELVSKEDGFVFESVTYLESKFLENQSAEELFNPEKYGLQQIDSVTISPDTVPTESGCFYKNQKLSDEERNTLWISLPLGALEDFESIKNSMLTSYEKLETEKIETPVSVETEDSRPLSGFINPTEALITAYFSSGHQGIDFANPDSPKIFAAASGVIVEITKGTWNGGYGNTIIIDHGNGYQTLYSHLSDIYVEEDQSVSQGEVIAKMGNTGRVYGADGVTLHYELRKNGIKVNPLEY